MTRRLALASLAPLALTACAAAGGGYPSLAPRAVERQPVTTVPTSAPVATPDAALDAKLAGIGKDLQQAARDFAPAADQAKTEVGSATHEGVGSTAWLDAQTALADLDGLRAQSTAALGQLDQLAIARAMAQQPGYPGLEALHDRAEAQVAQESATIAALQRQLPGS